jgi:hypothetical protein
MSDDTTIDEASVARGLICLENWRSVRKALSDDELRVYRKYEIAHECRKQMVFEITREIHRRERHEVRLITMKKRGPKMTVVA